MFILIKGYTIPLTVDNSLVYACVARTSNGLELSSTGYTSKFVCKELSTYTGYHSDLGTIYLSKQMKRCWTGHINELHQCKSYKIQAT